MAVYKLNLYKFCFVYIVRVR